MTDEELMREAIQEVRKAIRLGQSPFGACLALDGEVVSLAYNTVLADIDVTAHAEVNAIRQACKALNRVDLSGCVLYATCQPCPMCLGAAQRAGITRILYGVRGEDARQSGLPSRATAEERRQAAPIVPGIEITGDFLREEGLAVLELWWQAGVQRT